MDRDIDRDMNKDSDRDSDGYGARVRDTYPFKF
jgi:hypothetical protein